MRIETYFQQVREILESCQFIQSSEVTYDKRSTHEGFIRGTVYFLDESTLHFREFVDVETSIDRFIYAYHYMTPRRELIFRYDNTGHHGKIHLPSYPHHTHEGKTTKVSASSGPTLDQVLREIAPLIPLPYNRP